MTATPTRSPLERLAALLGLRRRASATTLLDVRAVTPNQAVWTGTDTAKLLTEGYEHAIWMYACIQAITRVLKPTRWLVYRGDKELDAHPLLDLLARPNEDQAGPAFLESAVSYYVTVGNAYLEQVAAGPTTRAIELHVKRPDRMRVIASDDGQARIAGYQYQVGGEQYRFEPWQIRHLKTWAPLDDWYGLGAIQAAARGIDLFNTGQAHNLALMQNGARPTGAWVTANALPDQTFTRLKQEMREQLTASRKGAPLLLEAGVTWQEMGISPRELDWLAGQVDAARQIHAATGVHPVLTGLESGTFENQEQAQRGLLINVVLPILDQFVAEMNAWIVPPFGRDLRLGYDRDAYPALSDDEADLWDRSIRGYQQGILTRNESRAMLGYGDVPDGDTFKSTGGFGGLLAAPGPTHNRATPDPDTYRATRLALQLEWEAKLTEWTAERFQRERDDLQRTLAGAGTTAEIITAIDQLEHRASETFDGLAAWSLASAYAGGLQTTQAHNWPQAKTATMPLRTRAADDPTLLEELMRALWGIYFQDSVDRILAHTSKVVGDIAATTKAQLSEIVAEGIRHGLSIPDIARNLDTLYLDEIIPNRSVVIARTETISSTNFGGQVAAKATGLRLDKRWLATTTDDRTRPEHLAANGQQVPIDQPYTVAGEPLMFPGDPNGSAANIIQCRCTETYVEAGETGG